MEIRAQTRAAVMSVRFRSLRIECRLVLLLSRRAVVSRCRLRGLTLGVFGIADVV